MLNGLGCSEPVLGRGLKSTNSRENTEEIPSPTIVASDPDQLSTYFDQFRGLYSAEWPSDSGTNLHSPPIPPTRYTRNIS